MVHCFIIDELQKTRGELQSIKHIHMGSASEISGLREQVEYLKKVSDEKSEKITRYEHEIEHFGPIPQPKYILGFHVMWFVM